jgi:hypothetical protein
MSIPLDLLYHFIDQTANEIYGDRVVIYRFWPFGEKKVEALKTLQTYSWSECMTSPIIWCNDQEPLAYDFYYKIPRNVDNDFSKLLKSLDLFLLPQNLNFFKNVFQKNILLHSEKRSQDIEKYLADGQLIPVYYWSHALIARDWFRYAEHENFKKNINKRFLIYNRAWSGTREYRLKFSNLLIEHDLVDQCVTFCNPVENDQHYKDYNFANVSWRPDHVLEHYFPPSKAKSCSSAVFDSEDYQSTEIEVVLETLFDDNRLHLTEKSLRPIACGQPFILASTHGSLQFLRDYGFQTFDTVWDESYDQIQDPYTRMQAIIGVMCDISTWTDEQRRNNKLRMEKIAKHNQQYFFSDDFFNLVTNELRTNLCEALDQMKKNPGFTKWLELWQPRLQVPEIQKFLDHTQNPFLPNRDQYERILEFIKNRSSSKNSVK